MISDIFGQMFTSDSGLQMVITVCLIILCLYPLLVLCFGFGSLSYRFLKRAKRDKFCELAPDEQPMITIMIPAHNEEVMIEETIDYLATMLNYSNYEILVINDGSTDQTLPILQNLQEKYDKLRVINILKNQGKAHGFNIGTYFAKGNIF